MATRKGRINRGSRLIVEPENVLYFYAKELVTAFDLAPDSPAYYEVGVPLPGGHDRYEIRVDGITADGNYSVAIDGTNSATQTGSVGTDAGWTVLASGLVGGDAITIGQGPDVGVMKAGVFSALPATTFTGFRVAFSSVDPYGWTIRITGSSVRGPVG